MTEKKKVVKLAIKGKYTEVLASFSYFVFWSNRSRSLVWCSIEYQWGNECVHLFVLYSTL
jgi:hypothetical protein